MKAIVLHGVNNLRYEEAAKPLPGKKEVLVKVAYCGVCGSDIPRIYSKGTYSFPLICGHEFAGTIEACGEDVLKFKPGDRVAVFPLIWCGKCSACEQGKYVQCENYDYLGSRSNGAFAEYVVVPERNLIGIPENLGLDEAAMTEPAAVALHAVKRAGTSLLGETVAVFGAGPIGLIAAQWAKISGASKLVLFDIDNEKLKLAQRLGFERAFNSLDVDPAEKINSLTSGAGAKVCIEAAGVPSTYVASLACAGRAGKVVLLGNPTTDISLPASLISQAMRRETAIIGTWNSEFSTCDSPDDWRISLAMMASGGLRVKELVSHRVALSEGIKALEMMRDKTEFFAKVLIHGN